MLSSQMVTVLRWTLAAPESFVPCRTPSPLRLSVRLYSRTRDNMMVTPGFLSQYPYAILLTHKEICSRSIFDLNLKPRPQCLGAMGKRRESDQCVTNNNFKGGCAQHPLWPPGESRKNKILTVSVYFSWRPG